MAYDFEKIGKKSVVSHLRKEIKDVADALQTENLQKDELLKMLKRL